MQNNPPSRGVRDSGMTLPELLIAMSVMGIIASVLATSIIVTLRQADSTEGRVNVARAEQTIDTWLPTDLASTDVTNVTLPAVDTDPAAMPCTTTCGTIDFSGANALQLAWTNKEPGTPPVEVITRVQYQYIKVDDEWQIQRIECVGNQPCTMNVMLHDLKAPADEATFNPDFDKPVWVMDVAVPENPTQLDLSDNARRVVVTIDGGGGSEGAGGGVNTVSLTAGGSITEEIDADQFNVPSFVRAKSRCGGPVTLIIDDSGSIGQTNVDNVVRPGAEAFIEAFRGTPTRIQVIQFSSNAKAIGPITDDPTGWHRYADMTNDTEVDALKASLSALDANGGTNWEEAFFHTFKKSDGTNADTLPNRVVFFTDGVPTVNRTTVYTGYDFIEGDLVHYNDGPYVNFPAFTGNTLHQESFDRADVILDEHRGTDLIFVGVGGDLEQNGNWIYNPAAYTDRYAYPASATNKKGKDVIAYLLANGPAGHVPATDNGLSPNDPNYAYTNPETADYYLQSGFSQTAFAAAMKAAALKDCGGTLTLQTKYKGGPNDGMNVTTDEFVFENTEYRDDAVPTPNVVSTEPRRVTTSALFRTGTFDFEISGGATYFSADIVPQELQTLDGYTFQGWTCRAGSDPKMTTKIEITDSTWEGFTVDVKANEAVSCVLEVSQP